MERKEFLALGALAFATCLAFAAKATDQAMEPPSPHVQSAADVNLEARIAKLEGQIDDLQIRLAEDGLD